MNNYPSDEEVSNEFKNILNTPFLMKDKFTGVINVTADKIIKTTFSAKAEQIDDIFYKIFNGLNEERKKAGFKPITAKRLATAINSNPWLKNSTEELYNILTKCEKAGNYKFASFILFPKKKK